MAAAWKTLPVGSPLDVLIIDYHKMRCQVLALKTGKDVRLSTCNPNQDVKKRGLSFVKTRLP